MLDGGAKHEHLRLRVFNKITIRSSSLYSFRPGLCWPDQMRNFIVKDPLKLCINIGTCTSLLSLGCFCFHEISRDGQVLCIFGSHQLRKGKQFSVTKWDIGDLDNLTTATCLFQKSHTGGKSFMDTCKILHSQTLWNMQIYVWIFFFTVKKQTNT